MTVFQKVVLLVLQLAVSNDKALVFEPWEVWNPFTTISPRFFFTHFLVVETAMISSMGQINLFENYSYSIEQYVKKYKIAATRTM